MVTPSNEYRPEARKQGKSSSEAGATHPALPAVILLVSFAVFMAAIAPLDFSTIIRKMFPSQVPTVPHQDAAVWADNNAGVYYCADSIMFGKTQGQYMKQVEALDRGYQPALGTYCTGPAWQLHSQLAQPRAAVATPAEPNTADPKGPSPFEKPQSQSENSTPAWSLPASPQH